MKTQITSLMVFLLLAGCQNQGERKSAMSFQDDVKFLKEHVDVLLLSDEAGQAQVVLVPAWQGRIVTSTANGDNGLSFGWINRELVASGERQAHINVFGGEDRFWLGPEGGQFSIFFEEGNPFDLEHWFVPAAIDWDPYEVVSSSQKNAIFRKDIHLKNYSGTEFDLEATREIKLLSQAETFQNLGIQPVANAKSVAFESINTIKNTGKNEWTKDTGLLSIWILGLFNPSPATAIVIPFKTGPSPELGAIVNDAYFGAVPEDRLVIKDGFIFFKGDGKYRSKIGISPQRTIPILGSYDANDKVLTIVQFTFNEAATDYVNSMWELQDNPYGGDVVNSYNDGPPEPGAKPLGPFYEMETSSPAAQLKTGETLSHTHKTIHFVGEEEALNQIAMETLGVSLAEIKNAFAQ